MGRVFAAGAVATGALLLTSTVANADESAPAVSETASANPYVYWSYWSGSADGTWEFAQKGGGDVTPADGTVEGWAYSGGSDGAISQPPRTAADFNEVCGNTDAVSGKKRVAVIVDFGTTAVAPQGSTPPAPASDCVTADPAANGLQVLAEAEPVRSTPQGQVCGINGYPASGCGEQVPLAAVNTVEEISTADSTAAQSTTDSSGVPTWVPFAVGGIIVIGLAGAAVAMSRRRNG
ncbi:MAG: hypothetical protein HQ526_06355 [Actinobacteria bacterium]|nr:hypothetical protein [Actinomycetota bacterium]